MWIFLFLGSVHSFSNGRAGYSHPNQHRQSGHEREEERGDVCLSTIDFKLPIVKVFCSHFQSCDGTAALYCRGRFVLARYIF